jgi:Bacterial conjugation TrbI-like protein
MQTLTRVFVISLTIFSSLATTSFSSSAQAQTTVPVSGKAQNKARLVVGESAKAVSASKIIWSKSSQTQSAEDRPLYVVVLQEPLKNSDGRAAIPAGAKLIVSVKPIEAAIVTLEVKSVVINGKEYSLPKDVFSVRSEGGDPITGDDAYNRDGGGIDLGQVFLGAINGIGRALTAPEVINSAAGTASFPSRDVAGAVLQGTTDSALSALNSSNLRKIDRLSKLPEVYKIDGGKSLRVVVNKSYG